jgi:hypothetical protein
MAELSSHSAEREERTIVDTEHLKLLSLAFLVDGCFTLAYSVLPGLVIVLFAAATLGGWLGSKTRADGFFPFWIATTFVAIAFVLSALLGGLKIYAGFCIRKRRRRILCLVVAAVSCFAVPYGTILGIATFYVLQRETVMALFDRNLGATELPGS